MHVWRNDLTGDGYPFSLDGARVLASFVQLTDLHVIDASSPARAEACQLLTDDPRWRPVLAMHRPYELLTQHAVASIVATIASAPIGPVSGAPFDLGLVTGDCIDNAQRNELLSYLALLDGGTVHLPYDGVQSRAFAGAGFWCPEPDVSDPWKRDHGFPSYPGMLDAINEPIVSAGIGIGWLAVLGNHDVMRQGTAFTTPMLEQIAVSDRKADAMPPKFLPDDALRAYVDTPEAFVLGASTRSVRPDLGRRAITTDEFIRAHMEPSAVLRGHGFVEGQGGNYVHDLDEVRIIVLDTNHPAGHFEGSVGETQLAWLEAQIVAAHPRFVVIVTHHGLDSLINEFVGTASGGSAEERLLAEPVAAVLHRHANVIAWVSGHRHINRIVARLDPDGAGPGFWDIVTSSIIDWPSQARAIEILALTDGRIVIATTAIDHRIGVSGDVSTVDGLATIHRELALSTVSMNGPRALHRRAGQAADRNALLVVR